MAVKLAGLMQGTVRGVFIDDAWADTWGAAQIVRMAGRLQLVHADGELSFLYFVCAREATDPTLRPLFQVYPSRPGTRVSLFQQCLTSDQRRNLYGVLVPYTSRQLAAWLSREDLEREFQFFASQWKPITDIPWNVMRCNRWGSVETERRAVASDSPPTHIADS